ncbi:MAG: flagellar modification protein B [Elusimicrobia bacterium]|nr:flagellar modification protein B [Elusimicrobiota bacterium]MBD3412717.1 flagellar modification protein B [Elusimicrobiota bacterium]
MEREKVLITIAARGGSKGIKDKNIRLLCGLPLIAHTVRQAVTWGKADRIICSTDSPAIAKEAQKYGAEVPFMRPSHLAGDECGKLDVLKHALTVFENKTGERFPIIIDLDVTAPIRSVADIDGAYELFKSKKPNTVFSVTRARRNPYFNMVEVNQEGYASVAKKTSYVYLRRQDAPVVYDMNASIYVYDRRYLFNENSHSAITEKSCVWRMDDLSAFDIDHEVDFQFIEFLVMKGLVKL